MLEPSVSLVPEDRCGLRMLGACHQKTLSWPPPPRLVGLKSLCAWGADVATPAPVVAWAAGPLSDFVPPPQAEMIAAITPALRPMPASLPTNSRRLTRPALKSSTRPSTLQSESDTGSSLPIAGSVPGWSGHG